MIENQDELRSTLEKNRELIQRVKQLEVSMSKPDVPQSELDELQMRVRTLFHPFHVLRFSFTLDRVQIRFDF